MAESSGWTYIVSVPSWTTGHSQGEDNVVYYNVEVNIFLQGKGGDAGQEQENQMGASDGTTKTVSRTIQRRFSDFRRLYDMLCMLYGQERMRDKQVPEGQQGQGQGGVGGGGAFTGGTSQSELIGHRREELDSWMQNLTNDAQLKWSPPVTAFLQVDQAIKEFKQSQQGEVSGGSGGGGFFRRRRKSRSNSVSSASDQDQVSTSVKPSPPTALQPANAELNELKVFLASETATKEFLAQRVSELEKELELVKEEARGYKEKARENDQGASEKMHNLQFELQEALNKVESVEKEKTEMNESKKNLQGELERAREEVQSKELEMLQWQERLQQVEGEKEALLTNSQADVKTLAREVKRVQKLSQEQQRKKDKQREEVSKLQDRLEKEQLADETDISNVVKALREAEVLHTRMQECTIDKLMMEENGNGAPTQGGGEDSARIEDIYQVSEKTILS